MLIWESNPKSADQKTASYLGLDLLWSRSLFERGIMVPDPPPCPGNLCCGNFLQNLRKIQFCHEVAQRKPFRVVETFQILYKSFRCAHEVAQW